MDIATRLEHVPETAASPAGPDTNAPAHEPSARRRALILGVASIASFMVALDLLVVTTALDTIRTELGASPAALQWTLTAYSVSFAGLLMAGAALGDRFGRRRVLALGLGVFVAGSVAAAVSTSVGTLIAARVVQGCGGALVLPLGLTIVASAYPAERRAYAIGVLEGITGLAVIAGPVAGGLIAHHLTWEWVFWINVPIGLAAIPLVLATVEERRGPDARLDAGGVVLVSAAAVGIVWGLVRGNELGWMDPQIVASLAGGTALAAAFVAWQRRAAAPLLPPRFFAARSFTAGVAASFLLAASLYGSVFVIPLYLQAGLGHDVLGAGLRLVPWTATLLVIAPIAGRIGDGRGLRPVLVTGMVLQAVGLAWLAAVATSDLTYAVMLVPLVVAGVGCSTALPVSQAAIVSSVPDPDVGRAAGANNMLQELGGAFGVAVTAAAFAGAGGHDSAADVVAGFRAGLTAAAVLAALGTFAALALPHPIRATDDEVR